MRAMTMDLATSIQLAESGALDPRQTAVVLGVVSERLDKADPAEQLKLRMAGRRLATPEVVQALLEAAGQSRFDIGRIAAALRLHGTSVVAPLMGRLYGARSDGDRRPYLELTSRLARFPELRDSLIASLR